MGVYQQPSQARLFIDQRDVERGLFARKPVQDGSPYIWHTSSISLLEM